jgi:hemoglobin
VSPIYPREVDVPSAGGNGAATVTRARAVPGLKFAASVTLGLDASQSVGETPDGVRLQLQVHGAVDGPMLRGKFPPLAAYMLIDVEGIGTLYVRAPVTLDDGAVLEIEATVRYDFGRDGYRLSAAGNLPDSIVAGGLRFLTAHPQYQWLNRALCLGVGELRSREKSIVYDLFVIEVKPGDDSSARGAGDGYGRRSAGQPSLYDRLGGRDKLANIVADFVHGLETNSQLLRQNPQIARVTTQSNPVERNRHVTDLLCVLTGGPCAYDGRPLKQVHGPMRLTEADWSIGGEELVRALNKNNVARADRDDLLALIEQVKPDIVQGR